MYRKILLFSFLIIFSSAPVLSRSIYTSFFPDQASKDRIFGTINNFMNNLKGKKYFAQCMKSVKLTTPGHLHATLLPLEIKISPLPNLKGYNYDSILRYYVDAANYLAPVGTFKISKISSFGGPWVVLELELKEDDLSFSVERILPKHFHISIAKAHPSGTVDCKALLTKELRQDQAKIIKEIGNIKFKKAGLFDEQKQAIPVKAVENP